MVTETLVPPDASLSEQAESLIHETLTQIDEHTLHRRLTLDLLQLLTSPAGRVGVCADTQCQWVFLDTSQGRNRQWCNSRDCGNRHRVRRHQERRTTPTAHREERLG